MEAGRPKGWALWDICLCQCGTKPPALRTAPQICLGLPAQTSESICVGPLPISARVPAPGLGSRGGPWCSLRP